MKQSRLNSWLESVANTSVGFGISLLAQWLFLPLLGVEISLHQNLLFALIMTVISIVRGYAMRRVFEHFGIRTRLSPFAQAVIAERHRQIETEGWSIEHDDQHVSGELAQAGAVYANYAGARSEGAAPPPEWPWDGHWWRPAGFRRDLIKAAALVVAEGEKFDRNRKRRSV